jgi:diguanylate cyclase (GGDEF)-like protein
VQTLETLANQVATSIQKARLYARAQEHLQVMTILQSVSHTVTSSLELNEILHNVIELLQASFGYTNISIYLLENDILRLGAQLGYPENMIIYQIPVIAGIGGRAIRTRETQFIQDVRQDPTFLRSSQDIQSEICVPLLKKDNVLGILNVESNGDVLLTENDVNLLNALAGPLAIAIDNARLHAEVKTMALTDTVSDLANRRAFDEILNTELTRATRYGHPLSLIILDLDSFKEYNDNYGHPAGDMRLREIGEMLKENVREPDIAARYGGEEFAVILPNTSKAGAVKLAERLRESAEAKAGRKNDNGSAISGYTISLGVATFPEDATTVRDLLLAADNAELTAKRLGKNRVYATTT